MTNYYSAEKPDLPNILSAVDSMLEQQKVRVGVPDDYTSSIPKPNEEQVHQYHKIRENLERKHAARSNRMLAP